MLKRLLFALSTTGLVILPMACGTAKKKKNSNPPSQPAPSPSPSAAPSGPSNSDAPPATPTPTPGPSSTTYTYSYEQNGCKTESHSFSSLDAMCKGLIDDSLNKGCARSMRVQAYINKKCDVSQLPASERPAAAPAPVITAASEEYTLTPTKVDGSSVVTAKPPSSGRVNLIALYSTPFPIQAGDVMSTSIKIYSGDGELAGCPIIAGMFLKSDGYSGFAFAVPSTMESTQIDACQKIQDTMRSSSYRVVIAAAHKNALDGELYGKDVILKVQQ